MAAFRMLLCVVGLVLSFYALHVERSAEENSNYEALCDLGASVSCTKVFMSEYGKGFGLLQKIVGDDSPLVQPNSVYGIIFYSIILFGSILSESLLPLFRLMAVASVAGSIYLGSVLYFVLGDTCIVCISTYIVNFALFFNTFFFSDSPKAAKKKTN